jgi:hypothetical protein
MPKWMSKKTPIVGSPEWKREQIETERRETKIKKELQSICTGC